MLELFLSVIQSLRKISKKLFSQLEYSNEKREILSMEGEASRDSGSRDKRHGELAGVKSTITRINMVVAFNNSPVPLFHLRVAPMFQGKNVPQT